jgi:hypothetical protein
MKDKEGNVIPNLVEYNKGLSTPIEAIGIEKPRIVKALPEWDEYFDASLDWKNCPKWNTPGKANENADGSDDSNPDLQRFDELADAAGLTNIEKTQLVSEAHGDYKLAIELLGGEPPLSAEDLNARLAEGDVSDLPY